MGDDEKRDDEKPNGEIMSKNWLAFDESLRLHMRKSNVWSSPERPKSNPDDEKKCQLVVLEYNGAFVSSSKIFEAEFATARKAMESPNGMVFSWRILGNTGMYQGTIDGLPYLSAYIRNVDEGD